MHIDEVHKTIKKSMQTTIKVAHVGIEYYKQRIKELEEVIRASAAASSDEVLPRNTVEAEVQAMLTQAVNAEINGDKEYKEVKEIKALRAGAMPPNLRSPAPKDGEV